MSDNMKTDKLNIDISEDQNIIIRPSIDSDNICISDNGTKIYECIIDDNNNIKGITEDNIKAFYRYSDNIWYFGHDIAKLNLISLADRTREERQKLGSLGGLKAKENREQKKNINELAKAMLEQTVSEDQIRAVLGDNTTMLLDNSVASLMLGSMIKGALNGSFKCFEAVRDTAGYKPKNEIEVSADIMTDADRSLIDKALKTS